MKFDAIAFDADDTLWHNMNLFDNSQNKFRDLLLPDHSPDWINERLYAAETRNLEIFGYGVKGFTLSMIETAIELTEGRITANEIQSILDVGKTMLKTPAQLLDNVQHVIHELSHVHTLMLITKGDLFDQERKIAQSGLANYFTHVEILSNKSEADYQRILDRYNLSADRFLMIGNSLRSDILPVVAIGGQAVHIPYQITWQHEIATKEEQSKHTYHQLEAIAQLPVLIDKLCR